MCALLGQTDTGQSVQHRRDSNAKRPPAPHDDAKKGARIMENARPQGLFGNAPS